MDPDTIELARKILAAGNKTYRFRKLSISATSFLYSRPDYQLDVYYAQHKLCRARFYENAHGTYQLELHAGRLRGALAWYRS